MPRFSWIVCSIIVMIESFAQQQQQQQQQDEQCMSPDLPDHAKPITAERLKYRDGDRFYYGCEEDFHFERADKSLKRHKIVCSRGQWKPSPLWRCVDDCRNACVHGNCVTTLDPDTMQPISKCVCQKNYAGKHCNARVCEVLPLLPHHRVPSGRSGIGGGRYEVEYVVKFACTKGYGIRNMDWATERTSRCTTQGWKPAVPQCEEIVCSRASLSAADNLNISPLKYVYEVGDEVDASCASGYVTGPTRLTCGLDGRWSPRVPRCVKSVCPPRPLVANANRVFSGGPLRTVGTVIQYRCVPGYYTEGKPTIKCVYRRDQPRWEQPPRCYPVEGCRSNNKRIERRSDGLYCVTNKGPVIRTTVSSTVKPLTIVTATAGALLLLLLIVISLVAYQRRRIALTHRRQARVQPTESDTNNDRFSFVYYTNDIHVVLPSYDEAVGTGAPPPYASESSDGSTENINAQQQQPQQQQQQGREATVDSEPESDTVYEVIDETLHVSVVQSSNTNSTSTSTPTTSTGTACGSGRSEGEGCSNNDFLHKEVDSSTEGDIDSVISLNIDDHPSYEDTAPLING